MLIAKIHLSPVVTPRKIFLQIPSIGTLRHLSKTLFSFSSFFLFLQNGKCYSVFSLPNGQQYNLSHGEKLNNYLDIKEKILDFYFQVALIVSWEPLQTEFAKMFMQFIKETWEHALVGLVKFFTALHGAFHSRSLYEAPLVLWESRAHKAIASKCGTT